MSENVSGTAGEDTGAAVRYCQPEIGGSYELRFLNRTNGVDETSHVFCMPSNFICAHPMTFLRSVYVSKAIFFLVTRLGKPQAFILVRGTVQGLWREITEFRGFVDAMEHYLCSAELWQEIAVF